MDKDTLDSLVLIGFLLLIVLTIFGFVFLMCFWEIIDYKRKLLEIKRDKEKNPESKE